jgi:hypothetical protein
MWMQDAASPLSVERPGRWVAEPRWPSDAARDREMPLNPDGLGTSDCHAPPVAHQIQSPLSVGLFAGKWCSYAAATDLPFDQREEDGGAMVFDSPPLEEDLEILGQPVLELEIEVDKPVAMIAARLSDAGQDGKVTRVSYGLLNLTHRSGDHENPEPVPVGQWLRVRIPMNHVAQRFARGRRLRAAISTSYWPLAWPSPEPVKLKVATGDSRLLLPVRTPRPEDERVPRFGPPREAEPVAATLLIPARREWTIQHNLATNESVLQVVNDDSKIRLEDIDLVVHRQVTERYSYTNYDYDTVRGEITARRSFERGDWSVAALTRTILTSTRTHFRVTATLDAYEGDSRIYSRSWNELIPRRLL